MGTSVVARGDQIQTGQQHGGHDRTGSGGENVRTRSLRQPFNHPPVAGHERAGPTGRLAERPHQDQAWRGRQPEMGKAALAAGTKHAKAVRIVDHQPGIKTFSQFEQLR